MGQYYRHLTNEERIVIKTLLQEGNSKQYIANFLDRNISTIKREIIRNSGLRGYRPKQAQEKADKRKSIARTQKINREIIAFVEEKIIEKYSPEQISGIMKKKHDVSLSHETIYQLILKDKENGGELYKHLRINNGKKNRKRYGKKDFRGRIPGRIDIDDRPEIVDKKERIGDWEADLVCGSKHKGFLVTLVDRKSKFTLIGYVEKKTADTVSAEIVRMLSGIRHLVKTITYDNGREFCKHEEVNLVIGCDSYFAKPYHSWERGLNENTNGLIRQYLPKKTDLRKVDYTHIEFIQEQLNSRPRKTLDFCSPKEIFLEAS
jgi:IS30 family transposase